MTKIEACNVRKLLAVSHSVCIAVGRILCMVLRITTTMYMSAANIALETTARNAAKLRTPRRMNAPTVRVNAETATQTAVMLPLYLIEMSDREGLAKSYKLHLVQDQLNITCSVL